MSWLTIYHPQEKGRLRMFQNNTFTCIGCYSTGDKVSLSVIDIPKAAKEYGLRLPNYSLEFTLKCLSCSMIHTRRVRSNFLCSE
jgi:hypothetical protein